MSDKLYDLQPLNALVDGNEKFRKYLIELFIETTPPILEDLKNSFRSQDPDGVYAHTHKVKPTLDSMGMFSLRPLVQEIMAESKKKLTNERVGLLIDELNGKIILAIQQLKENEL